MINHELFDSAAVLTWEKEGFGKRFLELAKGVINPKVKCTVYLHIERYRVSLRMEYTDGMDGVVVQIGNFTLTPVPGCSAIMVSSNEWVEPPYRGLGVGQLLGEYRKSVARALHCAELSCTVQAANTRQNAILQKHGWKMVGNFTNPQTNNVIFKWMYTL